MDFVKFLKDNSLRKKEIAEYLEVVPSVVSDICRGRIGLSPKNREKLEANDKGWGQSALGEPAKRLTIPRTLMTISVTDEIKREIAQLSVDLGLTKGEVVELAIKTIRDLE